MNVTYQNGITYLIGSGPLDLGSYSKYTQFQVNAGVFLQPGYSQTDITSSVNGLTLTNDQQIRGGSGARPASEDVSGGNGGIGVNLNATDSFTNNGTVLGGFAGNFQNPTDPLPHGTGATGGVGVALAGGAMLQNYGHVTGGYGGGFGITLSDSYLIIDAGVGGAGVTLSGGTLTNGGLAAGTITGGKGGPALGGHGGTGVYLEAAGGGANSLTNNSNGSILGGEGGGAGITLGAGTVNNQGTVTGGYAYGAPTGGDGVDLTGASTLTNSGTLTGGKAYGPTGVGGIGAYVEASSGATLNNFGTITGGAGLLASTTTGSTGGVGVSIASGEVFLAPGATVQGGAGSDVSAAGGTGGAGGAGIYMNGGSLVVEGTVAGGLGGSGPAGSGAAGAAIAFGSTGRSFVELYPGAVLTGSVYGNTSVGDILELGGQAGQSATLAGFGTQITGFDNVEFGAASWTVQTSVAALDANPAGLIQGFAPDEKIDLTDLSFSGTPTYTFSYDDGSGGYSQLTVAEGDQSVTLELYGLGPSTTFSLTTDGSGGTDVSVAACYRRGTRIRAEAGEVPIEMLRIGERVVTASGALKPIRWIGRRSYSRAAARAHPDVRPVRFRVGALGAGLPRRDLWVSAAHAMLLEGALVPAAELVNGRSILREERIEAVEYWHLELDAHEILLAEGALSESYADDGDRARFDNAAEYAALYPGARPDGVRFVAPRLEEGFALEAIRIRLAQVAGVAA